MSTRFSRMRKPASERTSVCQATAA
jgi:hypothetical protein